MSWGETSMKTVVVSSETAKKTLSPKTVQLCFRRSHGSIVWDKIYFLRFVAAGSLLSSSLQAQELCSSTLSSLGKLSCLKSCQGGNWNSVLFRDVRQIAAICVFTNFPGNPFMWKQGLNLSYCFRRSVLTKPHTLFRSSLWWLKTLVRLPSAIPASQSGKANWIHVQLSLYSSMFRSKWASSELWVFRKDYRPSPLYNK